MSDKNTKIEEKELEEINGEIKSANTDKAAITKEVVKPKIANPLPKKRRVYYVNSRGEFVSRYSDALSDLESRRHNP